MLVGDGDKIGVGNTVGMNEIDGKTVGVGDGTMVGIIVGCGVGVVGIEVGC
jgi:hypothetical protein